MKKLLLACLGILLSFIVVAQNGSFFKTFSPSSGELTFNAITPTHDGGYAVAGYNSFISGGGDFVVLKTDSLGNEQWRFNNNEFDGQDYDNYANKIIQTKDRGFIVLGDIVIPNPVYHYETIYAKFDSAGVLKWKKTLNSIAANMIGNVFLSNDTTLLIAGIMQKKIFVTYINTNIGDTLSMKITPDSTASLLVNKIAILNNEIYLGCINYIVSNSLKFNIVKTDSLGVKKWRKQFVHNTQCYIINDLIDYNNDSIKFLLDYKRPQSTYGRMFKEITIDTAGNVLRLDSSALWGYEDAVYLKDSVIGLPGALSTSADTAGLGVIKGLSGQFEQWCTYYAPDAQDYGMCSRNPHEVAVCGHLDNGINTDAIGYIMKSTDKSAAIYISDLGEEKHLVSVYPNPTSNLITFSLPAALQKKYPLYSLTMYDVLGKIVYSKNGITTESLQLNLSSFSKGAYTYRMYVPGKDIASGKFIIH